MKKKIVGIDYGLKRIGLAISNENHTFALPWTTILGGEKDLITALQSRKEQIQAEIDNETELNKTLENSESTLNNEIKEIVKKF